jgi:hypothetical protein
MRYFHSNFLTAIFAANPRKTFLRVDKTNGYAANQTLIQLAVGQIFTFIGLNIRSEGANVHQYCAVLGTSSIAKFLNCWFVVYVYGTNPFFSGTGSVIAENSIFFTQNGSLLLINNALSRYSKCVLFRTVSQADKIAFTDCIFFGELPTMSSASSGNVYDPSVAIDAAGYLYLNAERAEPQSAGVCQGVYNWEDFERGLSVPDIAMSTTLELFDYSPPPEDSEEIDGVNFAVQTRTGINHNLTNIHALLTKVEAAVREAAAVLNELNAHIADNRAHDPSETPVEFRIPLYSSGGRLAGNTPIGVQDLTTKGYVDEQAGVILQTAQSAQEAANMLSNQAALLGEAVSTFNERIGAAETQAADAVREANNALDGVNGASANITSLQNAADETLQKLLYLPAYDFGAAVAEPAELTAYALKFLHDYPKEVEESEETEETEETEEGDVEEEPRLADKLIVINLFNNHRWLYTAPPEIEEDEQTPPETPIEPNAGGVWTDIDINLNAKATNASLGVVKGSTEQGKAGVNESGEIELNLADWAKAEDKPSTVYSTGEVLTGDVWIDGKPIYRRAAAGTITAAAGERYSVMIPPIGAAAIIKFYGWWQGRGYQGVFDYLPVGVAFDAGLDDSNRCSILLRQGYLTFISLLPYARTNAPYQIVVEYTKVDE